MKSRASTVGNRENQGGVITPKSSPGAATPSNKNESPSRKGSHSLRIVTGLIVVWFLLQQKYTIVHDDDYDDDDHSMRIHNNPPKEKKRMDLMPIPKSASLCQTTTTWTTYEKSLWEQQHAKNKTLLWTVSGGAEYVRHMPMILHHWVHSLEMFPVFVVALDDETARKACETVGVYAVVWDVPKGSYSRVADAKFGVAAAFSQHGVDSLFLELDVFCRTNPLPFFHSLFGRKHQMVVLGHGDVNFKPNIGMYYVRASPALAAFFRSLLDVLRYSLESRTFENHNGKEQLFYDQTIFCKCLPPTNQEDLSRFFPYKIYRRNDTNHTDNLMTRCQHHFSFAVVSHVYVSNHNPPIAHDSALCVHPLANTAFTSLGHKLAVARFLGYDPKALDPKERFLKTVSGDLVYNECWNTCFKGNRVHMDENVKRNIQRNVAVLIWLARRSGRTLVMPRHVRDKDAFPAMLMTMVNIDTVEDLVEYRFLPREHIPQDIVVADNGLDPLLQSVLARTHKRVVAVDQLCRTLTIPVPEPPEISAIMNQLQFCMDEFHVKFDRVITNWGKLCGSKRVEEVTVV